ncbi:MAG: gamma carbonic anhydrase family protein, partial [Cyanobacteriota bacterium PSP.bin.10]|nr:gamma carbonic anhydrase family protein [Cyanobacteriota bacterium PSP.bin.10]
MQREKQDTWPIGLDRQPTGVDEAAFIAANATLIGDVHLSEAVSIWYGAILRG